MILDPAKTLFENFERTAARNAQRTIFTFLDSSLSESIYTYEQLDERVRRIARGFDNLDLAPGPPLAILLQSQEAQVLHYLAALRRDFTPAILAPLNRKLNRSYYLETVRAVFKSCHFAAVITDLEDLEAQVTVLKPWKLQEIRKASSPRTGGVTRSAFLQFSSGTTGIKRGVLVSDQAVLAQIAEYSKAIELCPEDRIVSWLPLYHDMGFMTSLNMAMVCGVHSIMMEPVDWVSDPGLYLRALSRYRATLGWNPNFAYTFMADRTRDCDLSEVELSSLRGLINCSEPVTAKSQEHFQTRFAPYGVPENIFWGCYAMAETVFALTHGDSTDAGYYDHEGAAGLAPRAGSEPFVSVGRPIECVDLMVAGRDGLPLGERQVGELWVKSPFNLSGYYNNQEATLAAFQDGWYKTGDLGYRAGSNYYICGRKKDVMIIAGENFFPEDIEDAVSQVAGIHPGRTCAFAVFNHSAQTERVVLLAETSVPAPERPQLALLVRQIVVSRFQFTHFELHLVAPGWLIKSSAGKMARQINCQRWNTEPDGLQAWQRQAAAVTE